MKTVPTRDDRLWRLKLRLGSQPRKFHTRLRPGGWITLPPGLGVKAGDQWEIEAIGRTLMLRRIESGPGRGRQRIGGKPRHALAAALLQMPEAGTDEDFARADNDAQ